MANRFARARRRGHSLMVPRERNRFTSGSALNAEPLRTLQASLDQELLDPARRVRRLAPLEMLEDFRRWTPEDIEPFRTSRLTTGARARTTVYEVPGSNKRNSKVFKQTYYGDDLSWRVGFKQPGKTIVCIRRRTRKQVMHAKGYAGGPTRRPRRTWFSSIVCGG